MQLYAFLASIQEDLLVVLQGMGPAGPGGSLCPNSNQFYFQSSLAFAKQLLEEGPGLVGGAGIPAGISLSAPGCFGWKF